MRLFKRRLIVNYTVIFLRGGREYRERRGISTTCVSEGIVVAVSVAGRPLMMTSLVTLVETPVFDFSCLDTNTLDENQ